MMINVTHSLVDYLFDKSRTITDKIEDKANECFQDYIAVTTAGAAKNKLHWSQLVENASEGKAELIGYRRNVDCKTAALINGFNAHALELDDGQRFAMIHLGASIISAIKAASDGNEIDAKKILKGIVMGYEVACRVAIAMQPSHKNLGYHAAGTCGTIGSAVGVAFALDMNRQQIIRVLSCAVGSAAGMLEMQEQKSEIKPYNIGRAAMDGLTAAYMGFTDYEVPNDMFGGERGFFSIFTDRFDVEKLLEHTAYFEIERIYVKPYASCRHSHSAVEAAIKLHSEVDVDHIDSVEVLTYKLGVKGHDHKDILGVASAKLSTPYAVAAGLLYGRADLLVFEPLDKNIIDFAQKVDVKEDVTLTAETPQKRIAIVIVTFFDGSKKECRVDYAKGDPENPMTEEELNAKNQMLLDYADRLSKVK